MTTTESKFHVLLIGVDHYFPNQLSNGGQYRSLGGCVRDVARVEAMLRVRLKGLDVAKRLRIDSLVAPSDGAEPGGDPARWPTADNIRRALADLAERACPGDQVYIHYAGHGGRVVTASKTLKGNDGVDEALVPMDIGRPDGAGDPPYTRAERYIRDVELALYLDRLASKTDPESGAGVVTTLVFDSCHSGGATRGEAVAVRAATGGRPDEGDPSGTLDRPRSGGETLSDATQRQIVDAMARLRASATRDATAGATTWLPPARSYVLLAACRDVESALEAAIDGKPNAGVLTDAFLEALATLGDEQSWRTVYDRVLARVHSRFPSQTPQIVGDEARQVFGVALRPLPLTLTVTAVDPAARTITVNGGLAANITAGTELGVFSPGESDFSAAERRVAEAVVEQTDGIESLARVAPIADIEKIQPGAPVVVQSLPLRRSVSLLARADLPESAAAKQTAALAAIAAEIAVGGKGFLAICPAGQAPHYQVVVTADEHYEICDPRGVPFAYLEPRVALARADAAQEVVRQLRRLGRYHAVLEMSEPNSSLAEQVVAEWLLPPPTWAATDPVPSSGGTPLARVGDAYTVKHETWVWLRLTNQEPGRPVNAALFDLTRTWEIMQAVPHPDDTWAKYVTLSGQPKTFAFVMRTPIAEANDLFKLFLAVGDVDFRAMRTGATRSTTRSINHALDRLLGALDAPENRSRDCTPARSPDSPWTVRQFRFRTLAAAP